MFLANKKRKIPNWERELGRKNKIKKWSKELWNHKNLIGLSILFLIAALVINYYSGSYVTQKGTAVVSDLILDNIPIFNLNFMFVYGYIFVVGSMIVYPFFFKVKKIHTIIFQISLLIIMRSFFIMLTHLKSPDVGMTFVFPGVLNFLRFRNDLFFSGHTAMPFMAFFVFKESKIKYLFLIESLIMGTVVLLTHEHYSIDVFSAFFITYGTYQIGEWMSKKVEERKNGK